MVGFITSRMTSVVTASIIIILSTLPSVRTSPLSHLPGNISQVEQITEMKNREDCLPNQYFVVSNFTCENCTYCYGGAEHFPKKHCGNGYGVKTTCRPCREGSYQINEGYTDLVCKSCVTCDPKAKVLRQCTPTQNAVCGDCPPGTYAFTPNVCFNCSQDPTQSACARPTPTHTAPTNQTAPTKPSLISLPPSTPLPVSTQLPPTVQPSPASSQTQNTSNDHGEPGTPTRKWSSIGITVIVAVIVICVILLPVLYWTSKKWRADSGNELPRKQQPPTITYAAYQDRITTDQLTTTAGQQGALPTPDESTPEESVALLPGGEHTGHTTTTMHEIEVPQGAGVPVGQPATLLSVLPSNTEFSVPGQLSSNGGPGGDGVYQHHRNNEPRSLDSAKDNSTSEGDDDTLSLPGQLRS